MHRMRHFVVLTGLGLASTMLFAPRATAALLRPTATASYPDIAADVNGTIQYQYDTQTQQGAFHLTNTPFLLAGGPTYADEYSIEPNVTDGVRRQVLNATLDSQGNLVPGAGNSYELYGTVVANNQVYSGLLLQGTPVEFGSASYTNPLDGKKD